MHHLRALSNAGVILAASLSSSYGGDASAITLQSLSVSGLLQDGSCTAASPTTFIAAFTITGTLADPNTSGDNYLSYLLDGSGRILSAGGDSQPVGLTALIQQANSTEVTPSSGPFELVVVDSVTRTEQTGVYVSGVGGEVELGRFSFDASTLDPDCPSGAPSASADPVSDVVSSFALNKGRTFLGNLPDLERLGEDEASVFADATDNGGVASFDAALFGLGASGRFGFWARGGATFFSDDGGAIAYDGATGFGQAGLDYAASARLRVGFMLQGDLSRQDGGASGVDIDGVGFLAGPYAVFRLSSAFTVEALALGGAGFNTAENAAGAEADYTSTRGLVSAKLTGTFSSEISNWWLRPAIRGGYYVADSERFSLGGVAAGAETVSLGELRFGPDIGYRFETGAGEIRPFVGVDGVATFATGVAANTPDPEGFSGSVRAGIESRFSGGLKLSATARYDGLGDDDYDAVSGALEFKLPLN